MMTLRERQSLFARMINELERRILLEGEYEFTGGDFFRSPVVFGPPGVKKGYGHKDSLHKLKLAKDINLFKHGVYITDTEGHRKYHDIWVSWGGNPMIEEDPNHYSWPYPNLPNMR